MAKNKTWGSLQVCTESAEVLNASQYSVVRKNISLLKYS